MQGLAQQLFAQKLGHSPWKRKEITKWLPLEKLLRDGHLPYIDYALAQELLRPYPNASLEAAAFLCHLSLAAREGHLCVSIEGHQVFPSPSQCWTAASNKSEKLPTEELMLLSDWISQGVSQLPEALISSVGSETSSESAVRPICRWNNLYYLQRYWFYETFLIHHFENLLMNIPSISLDKDLSFGKVDGLGKNKQLLPEQAQAILKACRQCFTVIYGGPGTGKTYTAGRFIQVYWELLSPEERENCEIALAAPTGKAAANLQKSLQRVADNLPHFKPVKAKTLHAMLGINPSRKLLKEEIPYLTADLILVDESSMIDVYLMAHLFASIKPGARLILLGDKYQLPSVEAGSVFADLVSFLHSMETLNSHAAELKICLRAELQGIVDFAGMINQGDASKTLQWLAGNDDSKEVKRIHLENAPYDDKRIAAAQQALIKYSLPFFPKADPEIPPKDLLEEFNRFRMLSPLRKGPFGVDALNALFLKHLLQKETHSAWFIAPIMIVSNDHRLGLFNGEVGLLVRQWPTQSSPSEHAFCKGDYALFPSSDVELNQDGLRRIPAVILPKYEYAYCLSVHKSQGSEYDHVLLLLPEGSELFGREALYTGATRARRRLEIWGSDDVLQATLASPSQRFSGIAKRLIDIRER